MKCFGTLITILSLNVLCSDGGAVLFYFAFVSKSVYLTSLPLIRELVNRGHEVSIISPFKSDLLENVQEIVVQSEYEQIAEQFSSLALGDYQDSSVFFDQGTVFNWEAIRTNANALSHPEVRHYLDTKKKFDVVINSVFVANEVGYYLSYKFNATLGLYFTLQCSSVIVDYALGQPHHPAIVNPMCFGERRPISLLERTKNGYTAFMVYLARHVFILPFLEDLITSNFLSDVPDRPTLLELESNAGFALHFSSPFILDGLRPTSPNFVSIAMLNCHREGKLPAHIEYFLNNSSDTGVILVSFGAMLTSSKMSKEKKLVLRKVFENLPVKVIWKWEEDLEEFNHSDKIMIVKWLPQQEILSHPNVKLFVTHGGQSSFQESLCHQKPMVVVSVFGDQAVQGEEADVKGFGVHVPFQDLSYAGLTNAIKVVLSQKSFTLKAREIGRLMTESLESPMDRAIWWIEHAIKYPGLKHWRSPVHQLTWYQYFMLDVVCLFIVFLFLTIFIFWKLIKFTITKIVSKIKID